MCLHFFCQIIFSKRRLFQIRHAQRTLFNVIQRHLFFLAYKWSNLLCVGSYSDSKLAQNFHSNGTGCHTANSLTSGGTSTASVIAESVFGIKRKIRMARTKYICNVGVITGFLRGVHDNHGNRCSGCLSFKYTGHDFYLIAFFAGRRIFRLARFSSVETFLYIFFGKGNASRRTIDNNSYSLAMRFSPCRHAKHFSPY